MKILITGGDKKKKKSLHTTLFTKHDIMVIGRDIFDLTIPTETLKFFSICKNLITKKELFPQPFYLKFYIFRTKSRLIKFN